MSCDEEARRQAGTLTAPTGVALAQVDGARQCLKPGCNARVFKNGLKCARGHPQDPAEYECFVTGWMGESRGIWEQAEVRSSNEATRARQKAAAAVHMAQRLERPDLEAQAKAWQAELEESIRAEPVVTEQGDIRLQDIPGQWHVKRGLEVAAAGGHTISLVGRPEETEPLRAWAEAQGIAVQAVKPCRCGNYGSAERECTCSAAEVARWRNRKAYRQAASADLVMEVPIWVERQPWFSAESGTNVLVRVAQAQRAEAVPQRLDDAGVALMRAAARMVGLGFVRTRECIKVAATIARLAGSARIQVAYLAEAIQYRPRRLEAYGQPARPQSSVPPMRFEDIPGQEHVKMALETALAGGHSVGLIAESGGEEDLVPLRDWAAAHGVPVTLVTACPCGCAALGKEKGFRSGALACTCSAKMLERHRARPEYQAALTADIVVSAEPVPFDKLNVADWSQLAARQEKEEAVLGRVAAAQSRGEAPARIPLAATNRLTEFARQYGQARAEAALGVALTRARLDGSELEGRLWVTEYHLTTAMNWALTGQPARQEA